MAATCCYRDAQISSIGATMAVEEEERKRMSAYKKGDKNIISFRKTTMQRNLKAMIVRWRNYKDSISL